jgi:mannose-6-phosphate isomerase
VKPMALPPNQLHRFYRGGRRIAELRGLDGGDERTPEDWIGSVTTSFGSRDEGLSRLGDGRSLADALAADPEAFLGPDHARARGADPALLVKLLDAGERLPVHFHPDGTFAHEQLRVPYGKSEAWVVIAAEGADPAVHLGLRRPLDAATLAGWVERQDGDALLAALNRVPVRRGDTFFVPAGLLHAIGAGLLIVELQEPSDLSVLLEWEGFELDGPAEGHLGLGFELALRAADRDPLAPKQLDVLRSSRGGAPGRAGVERLFPPQADAFFRAERIRPRPAASLPRELSILVVLDGSGRLDSDAGELALERGDTALVPWAAGDAALTGELDVLRCLPPETTG